MGHLVNHLHALGIALTMLPGGRVEVHGPLTDAIRDSIRTNKTAILAELAANDSATATQTTELRQLVAVIAADWPEAEQAEALTVALADPESALICFRALVTEREEVAPALHADGGMRSCRQCGNLTQAGRCLAAWRGEPFGVGIAILTRNYSPGLPDVPERCGAYSPGPADPDRRTGRERWPFLYAEPRT